MSIALALCASPGPCSCALRVADGSLHEGESASGSGMAVIVENLFTMAKLSPQDLEEVRVDLGPGSYTGLRVAVTFARTLNEFHRADVLTCSSLELHAVAAWSHGLVPEEATIRPVLDARRHRFHHAAFKLGETLNIELAPRATTAEELWDSIAEGDAVLAPEELHPKLEEAVSSRGATLHATPEIKASLLFHAALAPRPTASDELEPLYLMQSYAE